MRNIVLVAACLLAFAHLAQGSPPTDSSREQAIQAAEGWLALVDGGEYERSWDEAAAFFKGAVGREQWRDMLHAYRSPLGKLRSRSVKSARPMTSLPGAPDGEYVVIQFNASFEKKDAAVETVTPMRDPDDTWRVSGYFIK